MRYIYISKQIIFSTLIRPKTLWEIAYVLYALLNFGKWKSLFYRSWLPTHIVHQLVANRIYFISFWNNIYITIFIFIYTQQGQKFFTIIQSIAKIVLLNELIYYKQTYFIFISYSSINFCNIFFFYVTLSSF